MKVLHLIPYYIPAYQFGGPIISVHNLCKGLSEKGVDVTVWTTNLGLKDRDNIPLYKEVIINKAKIFYFPIMGPLYYPFSPSLVSCLKKKINEFNIIHIHGIYQFHSATGGFFARKYDIPYILSPRGMLLPEVINMKSKFKKEFYINLIERRNIENADIIHCTTEDEKRGLFELNFNPQRIVVIPNSVELIRNPIIGEFVSFRERYNLKYKFVILFLGRLNWKKGIDLLIPAFSKINKKHSNSHLVIAGPDSGGYIKKIREWVNEYNIKNKVTFTGMLKGTEKYLALKESDIFVLPSYSENFGMAVVEAMLSELPVIITKRVGIWNTIINNNCGKIVYLNPASISREIINLIENKKERINMGKRAKIIAEKEFSIERVAEKMIRTYESILN